MTKFIYWSSFFACCFLALSGVKAQTNTSQQGNAIITLPAFTQPILEKRGFIPIDSRFQEAIPASNDSLSAFLDLPFNFCYFGQEVGELYINNNGNVSINQPFTANTPLSFPLPVSVGNIGVIAPFWADADTRGVGSVVYRLSQTALVVAWNNVGYYDQQTGLTNTFQLVITDGTDPLLPLGYNVGFFYGDMNWTTGDQSNGINGFGGIPATVGMNRGTNNQSFVVGRFSVDNNTYAGPASVSNGVEWLSSRNMYFSVCDSTSIAPAVTGIGLSDTITVCDPDSIEYTATFIGLNNNTITTAANPLQIDATSFGTWGDATVGISNDPLGFSQVIFSALEQEMPTRFIQFPVVFDVDTLVPPVIFGDTAVCEPDSVLLTAEDSFQEYSWNTGSQNEAIFATAGTYTVTVSRGLCRAENSFTVDPLNPAVDLTGRTWGCFPDTMLIRVTAGYDSYQWSTSATDTLDSISITASGSYTITVTENGCSTIDSVQIRTLGTDQITVVPDTAFVCNASDSATLQVIDTNLTYIWSSGQNTASILMPAGTYTVTVSVTNSSGTLCSASDSGVIALSTFMAPVISGDTIVCGDSPVTLSVQNNYDEVSWSTGATTPSIQVSSAGIYRVTVTKDGCTADTNVTISEQVLPMVQITGGRYWCPIGNDVTLRVETSFDSVLWSTGSINTQINVDTGVYVIEAWLNGCSNTDTAVVNIFNDVFFEIMGDSILCLDSNVVLSVDSTLDTYAWSTGSFVDTTIVTAGEYVITATKDGCIATSDTFRVRLTSTSIDIIGDSIICDGSEVNLQVVNGFVNYSWSTGDTLAAINVVNSGSYTVAATDEFGCVYRDTAQTSRVPLPTPIIVGDRIYCTPAGTVLSTSEAFAEYLWSSGSTRRTTVAGEAAYQVQVVDTNGCVGRSAGYAVFSGEVNPIIEADSAGCVGGTFTLTTPIAGTDYLWSTGDTTDSITVNNTGIYSLTITNAFCTDSVTYEIRSFPTPFANFTTDPEAGTGKGVNVDFFDQSTVQDGGSIVEWEWFFGDGEARANTQFASYTYPADGVYGQQLTVTTEDGCVSTFAREFVVSSIVNVPNVITPNGDGINDLLVFGNLELYPYSKLMIFNRWGQQVFESGYYQNNWDGQFMNDGVYYFVLELGDESETIKGNFTIITQ